MKIFSICFLSIGALNFTSAGAADWSAVRFKETENLLYLSSPDAAETFSFVEYASQGRGMMQGEAHAFSSYDRIIKSFSLFPANPEFEKQADEFCSAKEEAQAIAYPEFFANFPLSKGKNIGNGTYPGLLTETALINHASFLGRVKTSGNEVGEWSAYMVDCRDSAGERLLTMAQRHFLPHIIQVSTAPKQFYLKMLQHYIAKKKLPSALIPVAAEYLGAFARFSNTFSNLVSEYQRWVNENSDRLKKNGWDGNDFFLSSSKADRDLANEVRHSETAMAAAVKASYKHPDNLWSPEDSQHLRDFFKEAGRQLAAAKKPN
jgi:hypothetical protein